MNPDINTDNSPFVVCRKHGTCRLSCTSSCNTRILKDKPVKAAPASMNTKDRKDYRRNQRALLKHLGRARNAIAEMDALTHGTKHTMLHSSVRNMRELAGLAYGMALDARLELWLDFSATPESVRLHCKSLLVLAQARGRDGDRTVQKDIEGAVALIQQLAEQKLGVVKPSDHPAGRGTGGLATRPTTGPTGVGGAKKPNKV